MNHHVVALNNNPQKQTLKSPNWSALSIRFAQTPSCTPAASTERSVSLNMDAPFPVTNRARGV